MFTNIEKIRHEKLKYTNNINYNTKHASRRVRDSVFAMSVYAYFKRTTGLHVLAPNGSLSGSISPQAIAAANREVEIYTKSKEKTARKRGSYKR